LRLSDELLDLDQGVIVQVGEKRVFEGRVSRSARELWRSLVERADGSAAACARLDVSW
jgi:hypothetical protein